MKKVQHSIIQSLIVDSYFLGKMIQNLTINDWKVASFLVSFYWLESFDIPETPNDSFLVSSIGFQWQLGR